MDTFVNWDVLSTIKIIPAILAKTFDEFQDMVKKIEPFTDLVHLDIADGRFVPNTTIEGIEELKKINAPLNFEVHLMVKEPEKIIEKWFETKAIRYLVHWESTREFNNLVGLIHENGKEFGAVLNPQTDFVMIEPYIEDLDLVQFMTVDPGFQGSPFLPEVLENIKKFHAEHSEKIIQVDGGIKPETIKLVKEAGAARAAVGSFIFESDDVKKAMEDLMSGI